MMSSPEKQKTLLLEGDEELKNSQEANRGGTPLPLSSLSQGTLERLLENMPSATVDALSTALGDTTNCHTSEFNAVNLDDAELSEMAPYSLQIETTALQLLPPETVGQVLEEVSSSKQSQIPVPETNQLLFTEAPPLAATPQLQIQQRINQAPGPPHKISKLRPTAIRMSEYPSNTPYPGPHQFEIFLTKAQESESKKTISYIYSAEENKLYVRMRVHCPTHFRVSVPPPEGSRIRAMAIYSRPQDVGDVVKRCMNHTMEDKDSMEYSDHLVRCHNRSAVYEELGPCKRHSVSFPWEQPSAGSDYISGIYEFMCFSSCSGTINRRPTQLIFTLEHKDEVIGRAMIELRICACPGRDIVLSENQVIGGTAASGTKKRAHHNPSPVGSSTPVSQSPSPNSVVRNGDAAHNLLSHFTSLEPVAKRAKGEDDVYNVQVRGRELYKIVMTIVKNYECARQYEQIVNAFQGQSAPPQLTAEQPKMSTSSTVVSHSSTAQHAAAMTNGGGIFPSANQNGQATVRHNGNDGQAHDFKGNFTAAFMPDTVSNDMPLSDWLDSHDLGHFIDSFTEHGLRTMEDLNAMLSMELLEKLGLPLEDRERLYSAFIQWRSMNTQLSSLSSISSYGSYNGTQCALDSLAALGGLRLARTTIRSNIKMPRKPKLTLGNGNAKM